MLLRMVVGRKLITCYRFSADPEPYFTAALVILAVYSFSCVLLIYGALKVSSLKTS